MDRYLDANSSTLDVEGLNRISRKVRIVSLFAPIGLLTLFFLFPIIKLFSKVIQLENIFSVLSDDETFRIFLFTFSQALISTIASLIFGIMPAIALSRYEFKGRRALSALVLVPFMLPTVVVASAFVALLPKDLHHTTFAVVIVHVFFNVAVVVRIVGLALSQIPRELEQSAQTLGASPASSFFHITFRLLTPAFISSSAIIFLFTFTSFGVIKIIGGPQNSTLEVEVARNALVLGDISKAAAISILQLIFLTICITIAFYISKKKSIHLSSNDIVRQPVLTPKEKVYIRSVTCLTVLTIATPIVALVTSSFRLGNTWSIYAWKNMSSSQIRPGITTGVDPLSSIGISFKFALLAVAISLVIGFLAAIAIYINGFAGKIVELGFALPLATSAVTLGFGMLITFAFSPINWRGQWWIIPIGHSIIAIPFVIRTLLLKLRMRPHTWVDAASTLGASPLKSLWSIDILRMKRPLVMGAAIAAAISFGEFGATTFLTRTESESMPIAIANLMGQTGNIPRAQGFMLASILAIVTGTVIFFIEVKDA